MIVVKLWESLATLADLQASLILLHYFRGGVGGGRVIYLLRTRIDQSFAELLKLVSFRL